MRVRAIWRIPSFMVFLFLFAQQVCRQQKKACLIR